MHYLKFLFKSTNAHGVHSPFVYDLLTQCFYKKNKSKLPENLKATDLKKRHLQIINDLIAYFKVKEAVFVVENNHFSTQLPNVKLLTQHTAQNKDLVYVSTTMFSLKVVKEGLAALNENGVMIVEFPYKKKEVWQQVLSQSKAHIVVQTYFFGFVFPKKTQAKEHFYVRI